MITFSSVLCLFYFFSQPFKPPAPVIHSVPKEIKCTDGMGKSHSYVLVKPNVISDFFTFALFFL